MFPLIILQEKKNILIQRKLKENELPKCEEVSG